jgi:acyl-CoA thioester hydrolase
MADLHPHDRAVLPESGFHWAVRVYYDDTDAGGVVYHASYLRYMERARTEWLRARGFDHTTLARDLGILFIVRTLSVKYQRPAVLDDVLQVRVVPVRASRGLILFRQSVERDATILVRGEVSVASVDAATLRVVPLPGPLQNLFGEVA